MRLSLRAARFGLAETVYTASAGPKRASARLKCFGPAETTLQLQTAQSAKLYWADCTVCGCDVVSAGLKRFSLADARFGLADAV